MRTTPFRRALAVLLCAQPILWTSQVAFAQTLQQMGSQNVPQQPGGYTTPEQPGGAWIVPPGGGVTGAAGAPGEPEVPRPERPEPAAGGATPIDQPIDPDKYILDHGDVLELNFWGVQNFRSLATIDMEGRAFIPKVGYFDLLGKTLTGARRTMREAVARHFSRLNFDVTLAEPRTFLVQLADDVVRPGSYSARAIDRVAAVIMRAGGFGKNASRRRIEIRRRDGTVIRADLLLYALTGDVKYNPFLLDGDVVRVPFEELTASISGAVNRPGRYELVGTRDLAELVDLAGGLAPEATRLLPISVVRRSLEDRQDQKLIDFTADGQLPSAGIQQEDAVRIPSFTDLQQAVTVIGAIASATSPTGPAAAVTSGGAASPGTTATDEATATRRLPFVRGDSVRTLLERVGGVGPLADLTGSYILRNGRALNVDLYALVMLRDFSADRPIELGDTLVVPFKRRNILVEGAVFAPGAYPYNPTFGVEQYLSLAGGRNRFAQPLSEVRFITSNGEMKEYSPDLKVEPGSTLVVPERNFSRSELVQIFISVTGIVMSGVALAIAASK